MRKKLFALLCALMLGILPLCISGLSEEEGYTCDSCGYHGGADLAVVATEVRGTEVWEQVELRCRGCGALLSSSWRPTGETVSTEPGSSGSGDAAGPEPPSGDSSGNGAEEPAVIPAQPPAQQPAQQTVTQTQPPVAPDSQPAPAAEAPAGQPAAEPVPQEAAEEPAPRQETSGKPVRRNLRKYPYFSVAFPSRRLDLEGDPDAWAPVPGIKVYPAEPEEGSSILQRMLKGN